MRIRPHSPAQCRNLAVLALSLLAAPVSAQCSGPEVGVPPDSANTSGSVFDGEALGQTFYADRTGIESITVWRVAYEADYVYGMRIFVVPTDSLGEPDVRNMIAAGPGGLPS